ncbi:MAG: hypothetical protein WCQ55_08070 [Paludibacteraceae bacterium]|nr:hypothetical protein [Prevotellaceae bacterium]
MGRNCKNKKKPEWDGGRYGTKSIQGRGDGLLRLGARYPRGIVPGICDSGNGLLME